jgi:hypothetical protein
MNAHSPARECGTFGHNCRIEFRQHSGDNSLLYKVHFNVTQHPSADWVVQQLRTAFPEAGSYRYVILDRDAKFDDSATTFLRATGLTPKTDQRASALAEWNCRALDRKLPL